MVLSDAIWNDVLEDGTAEKSLKNKEAYWCILTQFETMIR